MYSAVCLNLKQSLLQKNDRCCKKYKRVLSNLSYAFKINFNEIFRYLCAVNNAAFSLFQAIVPSVYV